MRKFFGGDTMDESSPQGETGSFLRRYRIPWRNRQQGAIDITSILIGIVVLAIFIAGAVIAIQQFRSRAQSSVLKSDLRNAFTELNAVAAESGNFAIYATSADRNNPRAATEALVTQLNSSAGDLVYRSIWEYPYALKEDQTDQKYVWVLVPGYEHEICGERTITRTISGTGHGQVQPYEAITTPGISNMSAANLQGSPLPLFAQPAAQMMPATLRPRSTSTTSLPGWDWMYRGRGNNNWGNGPTNPGDRQTSGNQNGGRSWLNIDTTNTFGVNNMCDNAIQIRQGGVAYMGMSAAPGEACVKLISNASDQRYNGAVYQHFTSQAADRIADADAGVNDGRWGGGIPEFQNNATIRNNTGFDIASTNKWHIGAPNFEGNTSGTNVAAQTAEQRAKRDAVLEWVDGLGADCGALSHILGYIYLAADGAGSGAAASTTAAYTRGAQPLDAFVYRGSCGSATIAGAANELFDVPPEWRATHTTVENNVYGTTNYCTVLN